MSATGHMTTITVDEDIRFSFSWLTILVNVMIRLRSVRRFADSDSYTFPHLATWKCGF